MIEKEGIVIEKMDQMIGQISSLNQLLVQSDQIDLIAVHHLLKETFERLKLLPRPVPPISVEVDQKSFFGGDRTLVQTILYCLLENAVIFQKPDEQEPIIRIKFGCDESYGRIVIEDNGIGMDRKTQRHCLEMFYKGSPLSVGSGLGLYLVQKILKKTGGGIAIESQYNTGTTVTVEIPNRQPV